MKEIVSIFLCGKMYGVDIENIQGIENYTDVIRTGGEPGCLDGFVVIRESQIPMINLRKKLVLPPVPVTEETKILIFHDRSWACRGCGRRCTGYSAGRGG